METDRTFPYSTNVRRIQWESPDVIITFAQGRKYRFANVPEPVYAGALEAESIGKYYRENIHGKYDYKEIK